MQDCTLGWTGGAVLHEATRLGHEQQQHIISCQTPREQGMPSLKAWEGCPLHCATKEAPWMIDIFILPGVSDPFLIDI